MSTHNVARTALLGLAIGNVTDHERALGAGAVMDLKERLEQVTAERDALRDENAQLRRALLDGDNAPAEEEQ